MSNGADREALGRAVEARRIKANLSIEEALRRSGLSRTTWRDVEKARGSFPSRLVLSRMAAALGAPASEILTMAGYDWAGGDEEARNPPTARLSQLEDRLDALEAKIDRLLELQGP